MHDDAEIAEESLTTETGSEIEKSCSLICTLYDLQNTLHDVIITHCLRSKIEGDSPLY